MEGNNVYVNWIICVLITFFMDQLVGVGGFMGLESHGMHVDADFALGNENPFNPVMKFRYGDKKQMMKDVTIWCFFILGVLNAIGAGSEYKLY